MRQKGFTLLEILIAITILSLIAVIIGVSMRLGIRAWERGESDTDNSQKVRYFVEKFSQQMKSVYPYQMEANGEKVIAFKGKTDSIFFVTSSVKHSEAGLKWISYFLEDSKLMITEGLLPDKKVMEKISKEGRFLDFEASGLKFEYFSLKDKEWKESWDSKTDIPSAIKITADNIPSVIVTIALGLKDDKK